MRRQKSNYNYGKLEEILQEIEKKFGLNEIENEIEIAGQISRKYRLGNSEHLKIDVSGESIRIVLLKYGVAHGLVVHYFGKEKDFYTPGMEKYYKEIKKL